METPASPASADPSISSIAASAMPSSTNNNAMPLPKAGFLFRYAALVVDEIIFGVPVGFLLGLVSFAFKLPNGFINLASLVISICYFWFSVGLTGTTLGKRIFNLYVTTKNGERPSLGTAFLREVIGKIISTIPLSLGYLWALWDKDKQAWHDKIASTYVVQKYPVGTGRKIIAWILVLLLPLGFIVGIVMAIIIMAINPTTQLQKAKEVEQQQQQVQQQTQRINDLAPSPNP